ncbi:MAG: hypothetical protein KKD11_04250 [Candidatus Omnitrophica bacterium]|nr:hypothetical protein [Candidatus Omnitrophota bacterium]
MKYDIDIFHYLDIYKKHYKRIIALVTLTVFIALIAQNFQPKVYRSTLIALSSPEGGQAANLGSYLGLPNLAMGNSSDDLVFSMLKSRRMSKDINNHFNIKRHPKLWWSLDTYVVTGGFAVEVKGSDPEFTRDIANFAVENLDKINLELKVTSQKPMVKVLDSALKGDLANKNTAKKGITSGLFVFLVYTLFIFFKEYFSQMKGSRK